MTDLRLLKGLLSICPGVLGPRGMQPCGLTPFSHSGVLSCVLTSLYPTQKDLSI